MPDKIAPAEVTANFIHIRPDWLALEHEEVLEPDLPIVDPHHHFWQRANSTYLLPDLLADTGAGHNVRATVFVECHAMYRAGGPADLRSLGETEFVNGIAAMSASGGYGAMRAATGIVGNVDLRIGDAAKPALEAHVRAAPDRFRGIRNVAAWHPTTTVTSSPSVEGLLTNGQFRRGFAALAPLGLSFDAWLVHTQLGELLDLARAFPQTSIILNHIGGPVGIGPYRGKREEVFGIWKAGILELARCPNLTVKLGGLGMNVMGFGFHEQPAPPTSEQLAVAWKPYIETCIEAFGADRCMFESNFPVDKGSCSYRSLWNAFKRITKAYSATDKGALYAGTALRVYRLVAS